jgi:large subunit ribosomal protein L25
MKEIELSAQSREIGTKNVLNRNRQGGLIPSIVYGQKETPVPVWVKEREFMKALHTERGMNVLIKLNIGSDAKTVLIKEIQRNVLTERPIHVDFHIISLKEKTEVSVPLRSVGEAPGVKSGDGVLEHVLREIRVRCLPTQIPDSIDVDISALNTGQGITVKDLPPMEGVEILSDPDAIIVHVMAPTKIEEAPVVAEATAAEPEVIAKGKKEEEGEAGAEGEGKEKEAASAEKKAPEKKAPEKKAEEKK